MSTDKAVTIIADPLARWGWIAVVDRCLVEAGMRVEIIHRMGPSQIPKGFAALEMLEDTLFGTGPRKFSSREAVRPTRDAVLPIIEHAPPGGEICIDVTGHPQTAHGALKLCFDGDHRYVTAFDALLEKRVPIVSLDRNGETVASAFPAIDDFSLMSRSLEQFFAAVADLVITAILSPDRTTTFDTTVPASRAKGTGASSTIDFFRRAVAAKIAGRIRSLTTRVDHWQVGYRFVDNGIWDTGDWSGPPHRLIPDDRQRYYADPFPFSWSDRDFIYVEEYPYRTGVGIISVAEIRDGKAMTPRPIVETGYHMSYPQIFHHEGSIFMIPETSANRTVELWRCDEMPDRWERMAVLLDDVEIVDATLAVENSGFWLFASSRPEGASACYRLGVWHAATLLGPYKPLDVTIADSRTARPGGAIRRVGDQRFRPAQDCSERYGGALTLCRIDRLDAAGFAQTMILRILPPAGFSGVHTLNTAGRLETIDLCGQVRVGDVQ